MVPSVILKGHMAYTMAPHGMTSYDVNYVMIPKLSKGRAMIST